MKIGNKEFDTINHTYIMGILNVTPDSFSDGGKYDTMNTAFAKAKQMAEEGADIIDIGGESTRPGYKQITVQEEIERVMPVIEKIKANMDIPVAIDTYKSEVAKAAIEAGVDLVNDIWGLKYDGKMASLIAGTDVACCLVHNRKNDNTKSERKTISLFDGDVPLASKQNHFSNYGEFIRDTFRDMMESIQIAEKAGIEEDRILLDPGVGFGKTYEMNIEIIRHLEDFHQFGYPMMLAASRKSVIGQTLDLPVDERLEGTLVTTVMAVIKSYAFVRVHDVKENSRVIKMAEKIWTK